MRLPYLFPVTGIVAVASAGARTDLVENKMYICGHSCTYEVFVTASGALVPAVVDILIEVDVLSTSQYDDYQHAA